jgi:hypothetical protein
MTSPLSPIIFATGTTTTFKCPLVDPSRLDVGFVAKWYETLGDISFVEAVAGSTSLIRGICNKEATIEFFRPERDSGAAGAADFTSTPPRIFISKIFVSSSLELWPIETRKLASIGACNGTITHEALHILHTFPHMTAVRTLRQNEMSAFQIIEDLFIETECKVNFPALLPFISLKNAFLFSAAIESMWETKRFGMTTASAVELIAKVIPMIKYFRSSGFVEFVLHVVGESVENRAIAEKVQDIANRAMVAGLPINVRIALAIELAGLLYAFTGGTGIAQENVYTLSKTISSTCKLDKAFMKKAIGGSGEEDDEKDEGDDEDSDDEDSDDEDARRTELSEIDAARKALKELSMELRMASFGSASGILNNIPVFVIKTPMAHKELEASVETTNLSKHLRQIQTPRTTVGEPRTSGRIANTRLWRIATDGKIFAERMHIDRSARSYEFAIAVDASSSMGPTFFKQVLTTAAGIKMDINEGGFPAQLLAFSADTHLTEDEINCAIYLIGDRGRMQMTEMRRYLYEAIQINLAENRDNLMITWASKNCFTDRHDTVKVLLVLSDGSPSAKMFRRETAEKATLKAIEDARSQGIIVIGVSIKNGVVKSNDEMYGSKFHVDASTPGTIGEQIAKTINSIFES